MIGHISYGVHGEGVQVRVGRNTAKTFCAVSKIDPLPPGMIKLNCPWFIEQYKMTDLSLCTAQIDQTVVPNSKKVFQTYHTNIPLRLLLYINVIFASF